ncbi:MAG TPA: DUF2167 domain-containing protein [Candidatus Didemnitutus sp.]|nr:DUF2167 domain-containing protein [Candidatus Didemnitutus sp.]
MRDIKFATLALIAFVLPAALRAADAPPAPPKEDPHAVRLKAAAVAASQLKYQAGTIKLPGEFAQLTLPNGYHYLDAAGTETLLTKIWRNPAGAGTLGTIVPPGFDPLGDESWAVILTYDEDGYVKDGDAAKINYDELLKTMQEAVQDSNKKRTDAGYPSIALVGWAAKPRYDAAAHKLYWAKDLKFSDESVHTLNYNIRVLGRRGVLNLNVVAAMPDLKTVEAATPTLLGMTDFTDGNRYADYREGNDKVATYGIAALVAGGIAAKAGLFKLLLAGILAFKKLLIIAALAIAGYARKLWASLRGKPAPAAAATPPPSTPTA